MMGSGYGRISCYFEEGDKHSGYIKCWEFLNNSGTLICCYVELLRNIIKQFLPLVLVKYLRYFIRLKARFNSDQVSMV
jgi:hypothetical protein